MITKSSFVWRIFLKGYFLFVNIKSIQGPIPLKHVLFFMRLTKFWLSMKDNMLRLQGSKLNLQELLYCHIHSSRNPANRLNHWRSIDSLAEVVYKYWQKATCPSLGSIQSLIWILLGRLNLVNILDGKEDLT